MEGEEGLVFVFVIVVVKTSKCSAKTIISNPLPCCIRFEMLVVVLTIVSHLRIHYQ